MPTESSNGAPEGRPHASGLRGRFAVVKLWPNLKTAEDECIARLKITANTLGLECLEVDSFARLMASPHTQLTQDDVDFVLSLHFDTPKRYDIFSFVALWNPVQFFHEWGYRRCTRNLLTHDDFLSCSSPVADDQVGRLVARDEMRDFPELRLYHSLSEPIFPPTTGEGKLFYTGINWERISNKPQRHGELLKLLEQSGDLRIYGPRRFQGVEVWSGYKSYVGPIPFDGVSIVRAINKAGISLVLSSEAHLQSELMSSRLFESLAAGAVVICDQNPFARRHFDKTLLYIDTGLDPEETYNQVQSHLEWVRSEPVKARELAREAQEIFRREFSLGRSLETIYRELPARKKKLECLRTPKRPEERISVIFLMPEFQSAVLERHLASCLAQEHVAIHPILVMDGRDFELFGPRIKNRLNEMPVPVTVETLDFTERYPNGAVKTRMGIGRVIQEAIRDLVQDEYFCIVGPHEHLFSDHLASLLRTLQEHQEAGSAWADALWAHTTDGVEHAELTDDPEPRDLSVERPIGFGRFLFRKAALPPSLTASLSYLDVFAMHLLVGITEGLPSKRCTAVIDIQDRFNTQIATSARVVDEREILIDCAPSVFRKAAGGTANGSPNSMTSEEKAKLAVELVHSVPLPGLMKKIVFGLYRFWLRRHNARQRKTNV